MDTSACVGTNVDTSCVFSVSLSLIPVWVINNDEFSETELDENPVYEVVNTYDEVTDIGSSSLRVFNINDSTTFQCRFPGLPNTSQVGTVTVFGMYQCTVIYVCAQEGSAKNKQYQL